MLDKIVQYTLPYVVSHVSQAQLNQSYGPEIDCLNRINLTLLRLQIVYSALTQNEDKNKTLTYFRNVAVGIAPVWFELQILHSMRNLVGM